MCNKSYRDLTCIPSSETPPTSNDHSKVSVGMSSDNFEVNNCSWILCLAQLQLYIISIQVTCHAVQDTDNDEDLDNIELLTNEYRSAPAYCNNEVNEIFELLGM